MLLISAGKPPGRSILLEILALTGRDCCISFGDSAILFRILEMIMSLLGAKSRMASRMQTTGGVGVANAACVFESVEDGSGQERYRALISSAGEAADKEAEGKPRQLLPELQQAVLDIFRNACGDTNSLNSKQGSLSNSKTKFTDVHFRRGVLLCFMHRRLTSQEVITNAEWDYFQKLFQHVTPGESIALRKLAASRHETERGFVPAQISHVGRDAEQSLTERGAGGMRSRPAPSLPASEGQGTSFRKEKATAGRCRPSRPSTQRPETFSPRSKAMK